MTKVELQFSQKRTVYFTIDVNTIGYPFGKNKVIK